MILVLFLHLSIRVVYMLYKYFPLDDLQNLSSSDSKHGSEF